MGHRIAATALGLGLGSRVRDRVRVRVRVRVGVIGFGFGIRAYHPVRSTDKADTCELPGGPYASCIGLLTKTRPTSVGSCIGLVGHGPLEHLCNRPMHADEHAPAEPARHLVRVKVKGSGYRS